MTVTGSSLRRSTRRFAARLSPPLANDVSKTSYRPQRRTALIDIELDESIRIKPYCKNRDLVERGDREKLRTSSTRKELSLVNREEPMWLSPSEVK